MGCARRLGHPAEHPFWSGSATGSLREAGHVSPRELLAGACLYVINMVSVRSASRSLLVVGLLAAVGFGCDNTYEPPSGPIEVSGRVVIDGGGPVADLGVELLRYVSPGGASAVVSTRTDMHGEFDLRYVVREGSGSSVGWQIQVNSPYDDRYTVDRRNLPSPPVQLDLGTFELSLNGSP